MKLVSVSSFKQVNIKTRTNIQKPVILEHKIRGKKTCPNYINRNTFVYSTTKARNRSSNCEYV